MMVFGLFVLFYEIYINENFIFFLLNLKKNKNKKLKCFSY